MKQHSETNYNMLQLRILWFCFVEESRTNVMAAVFLLPFVQFTTFREKKIYFLLFKKSSIVFGFLCACKSPCLLLWHNDPWYPLKSGPGTRRADWVFWLKNSQWLLLRAHWGVCVALQYFRHSATNNTRLQKRAHVTAFVMVDNLSTSLQVAGTETWQKFWVWRQNSSPAGVRK